MAQRADKVPTLRLVRGGGAASDPAPRFSDEELIAAVQTGDRSSSDALYDRLIRVVDSTLFKVLGARDTDFDDLVQSTFEAIVTTLAELRYARACSLSSWAGAIACNVALKTLRSRRTRRRYFDDRGDPAELSSDASGGCDPERQVMARQQLARLREHLAQMKPERVEVLLLHDMLRHELSEIAVLKGISVAAAQSRLVRGRKELNRRLSRDSSFGSERP